MFTLTDVERSKDDIWAELITPSRAEMPSKSASRRAPCAGRSLLDWIWDANAKTAWPKFSTCICWPDEITEAMHLHRLFTRALAEPDESPEGDPINCKRSVTKAGKAVAGAGTGPTKLIDDAIIGEKNDGAKDCPK